MIEAIEYFAREDASLENQFDRERQLMEMCLVCGRKMSDEDKKSIRMFYLKLEDGDSILHSGHENCVMELHELLRKLNYDLELKKLVEAQNKEDGVGMKVEDND